MSSSLDRRRLWTLGAIAAAAATIANMVIYGGATLAGVTLQFIDFNGASATVAAWAVVAFTVAPFTVGLLLTMLVAGRAPRRLRAVQIVAVAFTLVSLLPPLALEADAATRLTLAAMHPVAGAAFVLALERLRAETRRTPTAGQRPPAVVTG